MDMITVCRESAGDVARMLAMMPDITLGDLAKAVSVSAMVLQQEAYTMIAEAREMDGTRRMKRAFLAADMLAKAGALSSTVASLRRASVADSKRATARVEAGTEPGQLRLVKLG